MEKILNEIESFLFANECKKVSFLLTLLFSKYKSSLKALEALYSIGKNLISQKYIKEATFLLSALKSYALNFGEAVILTDIKNLLSYCYRLKKKIPEAVQECKDSIAICKSKPELYQRLPVLYLNLSAIYREDVRNYALAKAAAQSAYEVSLKILDKKPDDKSVNRNLAVCILALGQLDEVLDKKESAVLWYSRGIELDNIDIEMINLFKTKLYGVSFKKTEYRTPRRQSVSSRQGLFSLEKRTSPRVHSRTYSISNNNSNNTSVTASSHFSELNRKVKKIEYELYKVVKIQNWYRMILQRFRYGHYKLNYDYFDIKKKVLGNLRYLVSVYRNYVIEKGRFTRKKIEPIIYVEAFPLETGGKLMQNAYELGEICRCLGIEQSEVALRKSIKLLIKSIQVYENSLEIII